MANAEEQKVSFDGILVEELGQFGRYQKTTLLLAALPILYWALGTSEYVFSTARIPTRCFIPECDGADPDFAAPWRDVAIPQLASGAFDQCSRFGSNSSLSRSDSCPASLFDHTVTEPCKQFVYQNNNTIVNAFDLGCDEWRRSLVGSFRTIGVFLSLPLTGYASDRWGRRAALVLNALNAGVLGVARSFVGSYQWFVVLSVAEALLGYGSYSSGYMLTIEIVGPKYRVMAGAILASAISVGHGLLGLLAWSIPDWRTLTQVVFAPQLIFLLYFWIISESARWLITRGRYEEAKNILNKAAACNKKTLSDKSWEALQKSAEADNKTEKAKKPCLLMLVFKSPVILKRCCIVPIWWFTNIMTYYGLSVSAVNLSGNAYFNYSMVGLVDIVGHWTAYFLLDRVGRRPVIIIGYIICSASQFAFTLVPDGLPILSLALYLMGKSCIAAISSSVYMFTVELFPTAHRHKLFGFCSMIGRLGSVVAPLMPSLAQEVWAPLPSVLFGSFALASAMLVITVPETLGSKLPETMEEAEDIGKNKILKCDK